MKCAEQAAQEKITSERVKRGENVFDRNKVNRFCFTNSFFPTPLCAH